MSGTSLVVSGYGTDPEDEDDEQLSRFKRWHRYSRDHFHTWRETARVEFDLIAGHQWAQDDIDVLEDEERTAITFNRSGPFIDGICGLELNNRQETVFLPRTQGVQQIGATDIMTAGAKWARDECNAEDEESAAFRSMVICGMGCTQTRMDYDEDPDGLLRIEAVDIFEMYPDPSATRSCFEDAEFVIRVRQLPLKQAMAENPGVPEEDLDARWARGDASDAASDPDIARDEPFYRGDQAGSVPDLKSLIHQVEVEWWDYQPMHRVKLHQGHVRTVTPDEHDMMQAAVERAGQPPLRSFRTRHRVYRKAIVGRVVLSVEDGPERGGFTYKFMTGKYDVNKRIFYGLGRAMKDPQMWQNKWFTQMLHIINTSPNSGAIVEKDAIDNVSEFLDDYARPGSVSILKAGGLAKFKEKAGPQFPAAIAQVLTMGIEALPQVTGVTPEMIGQVDREQAGILEMHRKQSAITVLADFFNAKRRYQKTQGKLLLWMLHRFIADGRLIRISGKGSQAYIPFTAARGFDEYDVVIDETPTSPNMREKTWGVLQTLLPLLSKMGVPPPVLSAIAEYLPLPASLIGQIQQALSQPPQPDPMHQAQVQLTGAKAQLVGAQARHQDAKTQIDQAEAQTDRMTAMGDIAATALDQQSKRADIELKRATALMDLSKGGIEADQARLGMMATGLEGLLNIHAARETQIQGAHDRAMDVMQHKQDADAQAHQQQMAEVGADQQQQQIDAPPAPTTGAAP